MKYAPRHPLDRCWRESSRAGASQASQASDSQAYSQLTEGSGPPLIAPRARRVPPPARPADDDDDEADLFDDEI